MYLYFYSFFINIIYHPNTFNAEIAKANISWVSLIMDSGELVTGTTAGFIEERDELNFSTGGAELVIVCEIERC